MSELTQKLTVSDSDIYAYKVNRLDRVQCFTEVNRFSKLSRMQKWILEELYRAEKHRLHVSRLSWKVANREPEKYVWNMKRHAQKIIREEKPEVARYLIQVLPFIHKKTEKLTASFRASFSRSLHRLHRRELIQFSTWTWIRKDDGKLSLEYQSFKFLEKSHSKYVELTELGIKACKQLFGEISHE